MSIEALTLALHHSRAKGTDLLILMGIANHDGDGGSWPSIATLAKYARCSDRRVQTGIQTLEAMGEIAIARNAGGTHRTRDNYRPNHYTILVACPADCDRTTSHRARGEHSRVAVNESAPGVNTVSPLGVNTVSPEPSLESSLEPTYAAAVASAAPTVAEVYATAADSGVAPTLGQRANALAKVYYDRVPLSNFAGIAMIARKAIKAGTWSDDEIAAALGRMADDGRSVTTDALRYELTGFPDRRSNRDRRLEAGVERTRRLAAVDGSAVWEIES